MALDVEVLMSEPKKPAYKLLRDFGLFHKNEMAWLEEDYSHVVFRRGNHILSIHVADGLKDRLIQQVLPKEYTPAELLEFAKTYHYLTQIGGCSLTLRDCMVEDPRRWLNNPDRFIAP